jgi:hypothetical protein
VLNADHARGAAGGVPVGERGERLREERTVSEVEGGTRGRMFGDLTITRNALEERFWSPPQRVVDGHGGYRVGWGA